MIKGVYRNGHVELATPVDWPEGCQVNLAPTSPRAAGYDGGLDESTWEDTPENREWLIAQWEALEPPKMTDADWAEWEAARRHG